MLLDLLWEAEYFFATRCSIFPYHKSEFLHFHSKFDVSSVCPIMAFPHVIPSRGSTILLTISHSSWQLARQEAVLAAAHLGLGMCSF